MAKVKKELWNSFINPVAEHSQDHSSVSGISTAFYTHNDDIIMRTKPKSPPHTSESQKVQHELWKDADCMWNGMTRGQRFYWARFYDLENQAGRTRYTVRTKELEANQQIPHKDMGQHALFMSHGLRLDLLAYLKEHLLASWLLVKCTDKGTVWEVEARLVNSDLISESQLPPERLPARGRT